MIYYWVDISWLCALRHLWLKRIEDAQVVRLPTWHLATVELLDSRLDPENTETVPNMLHRSHS